jgi:hypothetical protein
MRPTLEDGSGPGRRRRVPRADRGYGTARCGLYRVTPARLATLLLDTSIYRPRRPAPGAPSIAGNALGNNPAMRCSCRTRPAASDQTTASAFGQRWMPEEISGKAIDLAPRSAATASCAAAHRAGPSRPWWPPANRSTVKTLLRTLAASRRLHVAQGGRGCQTTRSQAAGTVPSQPASAPDEPRPPPTHTSGVHMRSRRCSPC